VDEKGVDMEVAVPVAGAVEEEWPEGIHVIELPAGPAAMTLHVGPYEECGAAYEAIDLWMHEHGREPKGPCWEVYLTDPADQPDPREWA
jgi:AraC family transcriptional regulator